MNREVRWVDTKVLSISEEGRSGRLKGCSAKSENRKRRRHYLDHVGPDPH